MSHDHAATLDGIEGRGYAVVESLVSLGKGKRCDGVFVVPEPERGRVESLASSGEAIRFGGTVYHRHLEERREMRVRVTRVADGPRGITAEFTALDEF